MMLRLEPGDVALAVVVDHLPESEEGRRLMGVAPDSLLHRSKAVHERIGRHHQQALLAVDQPPQQCIKKREPLRVAVADGVLGKFDIPRRDGKAWRVRTWRSRRVTEQAGLAAGFPRHV